MRILLAIVMVAALVTTGTAAAAPAVEPLAFAHPGVLVTRAQLDNVKQKLAAGAQPWTSANSAMRASSFASLSWTAKPRTIVECGPSSNPNLGCSDERNDAVAAYTHALQWYLTGDTRHAQKAVQVMDAWSAVITDHTNSNAQLQTGWAGAAHVAETAWIQGIDLYGEMRERMTKALEFHANYELGASVPGSLCSGSLETGPGPTLEVAHNHYRNRTDTRLPKTLQVIQSRRPMGVSHFIVWETLTHAINP